MSTAGTSRLAHSHLGVGLALSSSCRHLVNRLRTTSTGRTSLVVIHPQISVTDAFRNGATAVIVLPAWMPAMVTTGSHIVSPFHYEMVWDSCRRSR
jgi:hypothetical protein